MRRLYIMRSFLLAVVLAQITTGLPVLAVDKKPVDQLIEETRSALQQTKKREKAALTTLTKNQRELNRTQSNLNRISDQLWMAKVRAEEARKRLERIEAELLALEDKLNKRRELMRRRVGALYRYGPINYLEVVLAATDFADLVNRYELSSYFIRQDLKLLDEYRETHKRVKAKREEVLAGHEELQEAQETIQTLQSRAAVERGKAADKVKSTQEQVRQIQVDRIQLERALEEYERLSRELGAEMRRKGSSAALGTGKMMWPVVGRLSSGFGWRPHPVLRSRKFHNGQDIAVPEGTPVLAADSGIVAIAGWRGGYGWLVVIDHGRGLSTFYGHNSALLVRERDVVVKGQRIARSGNTGLSSGPHLHFEVRIDGEPVNPLPYLP